MKKILLAYSGGLDTTYCLKYFQNQGYEVDTVIVNTGGFSSNELDEIKEKAESLGANRHIELNQLSAYYNSVLKYLIFGNVLRNGNYPISVSSERIVQAFAITDLLNSGDYDYVAHGSTGAGNDQVRFDLFFSVLAPHVEIITPIRDLGLTRTQEVDYLIKNGVELNWDKAKYSVNKGLWGTSVGGDETLVATKWLPEEAFPSKCTERESICVQIAFDHGEVKAINGVEMEPVEIIEYLNDLGSKYAIGRGMHVGDTIMGIKGRIGFEAPAPHIIIESHKCLEKHVLSKDQMFWKDQFSALYGNHIHEGKFLDPLMRNIEAFLFDSQQKVKGIIDVLLSPYRFEVKAVHSENDLMQSKFGVYGEENLGWTSDDAKGFIKVASNAFSIYEQVNYCHEN